MARSAQMMKQARHPPDQPDLSHIIIPRRGDVGEMIALTQGGALILFTCMAATLWSLSVRNHKSSFPNDPSPRIWPAHSKEPCPVSGSGADGKAPTGKGPPQGKVLSKWRLTPGTSPQADSKGAFYNGGRSFSVEGPTGPEQAAGPSGEAALRH